MTNLTTIRQHLERAAEHEPAAAGFIATLNIQLKGFAKADDETKARLKPRIEETIQRIERARTL